MGQVWNPYGSSIMNQPNSFVIADLVPAQWYQIRVTAENSAGISTALYNYATTTVLGGKMTFTAQVGGSLGVANCTCCS